MSKGHVTHAERNGVHILRYFGRVDYMSAPAIQHYLERLLVVGGMRELVVDLSGAEALDSTNLGLLARINARVARTAGTRGLIISMNEDINEVLRSMGFDQTFDLVTDPTELCSERDQRIDAPCSSADELRSCMLDAHRALVQLSDAGRLEFQDVVRCLESERSSAPSRDSSHLLR